jgi:hypothetical protein
MAKSTAMKSAAIDDVPQARFFREKIGDKEYELREAKLDVFDEVALWDANPRLMPYLAESDTIQSEDELEAFLRRTKGYDVLTKSIAEVGQMEPVYVWKRGNQPKFLTIDGATRITILREQSRKNRGKPDEVRTVKAKVLPPDFSLEERAILLAKIHVRGTGIRSWGRYIEARFVYETVAGDKPLMTMGELARHMGKSVSWVSRLKDAYQFAQKFVDYLDSADAPKIAADQFSTLEEIAKSSGVGPMVRDYDNDEHEPLRRDVFDMVKNGVFKEYRDARFMKEYHDDPEKWALLKQGEKGIANKLATDIKAGNTSLKAKLAALPGQIERALERDAEALNDGDAEALRAATKTLEAVLNPGVERFRLDLNAFTTRLASASLMDVKSVLRDDLDRFEEALEDFRERLAKYNAPAAKRKGSK